MVEELSFTLAGIVFAGDEGRHWPVADAVLGQGHRTISQALEPSAPLLEPLLAVRTHEGLHSHVAVQPKDLHGTPVVPVQEGGADLLRLPFEFFSTGPHCRKSPPSTITLPP